MSLRLLGLLLGALSSAHASWDSLPASVRERAVIYKPYLQTQAVTLWGKDPPLPLFAAQIHQESLWNPNARSAYACGLTQFTPDTQEWIKAAYKVDVGDGHCLDPKWAIRAMIRYDKHLSTNIRGTASECDNRKWMLSAYNGGLGWVNRDRNKAAIAGVDNRYYKKVYPFNAGRSAAAYKENRDYPEKIVGHQLHYITWNGPLTCYEEFAHVKQSDGFFKLVRGEDPWRCAGVDKFVCRLPNVR
jgi:soluble lytic murein transglycosylase-like protein